MRIVGIGASAGGLTALTDFFRNTPDDTGMAFLVVQHLDPTQKGMLPELLQRCTRMPVQEAGPDMPVHSDCVYVIPPNRELRVVNSTLKLDPPSQPRGLRLPINVLFSSLASAQNELAIAVVLSGMGWDGTLGLQAIRATGGLTLVQSPESAQFDAMPKSAIAAGCADIVAPAAALPGRILEYVRRVPEPGPSADLSPDKSRIAHRPLSRLDPIFRLLRQHTGQDFSLYKPSTLNRRIERRMAIHGISGVEDYSRLLEANTQEIQLLFRELLIGVTQFFRDPETWDYLIEQGLPELLKHHPPGQPLRAWVVGCSTGEEAYSLAIAFTEVMEKLHPGDKLNLKIFASDISPEAVAAARRGQYSRNIESVVSKERLARFFSRHGTYYRVEPLIRDKVMFASHNVILEPPFTNLDLLVCRNLLIYFDLSLQRRILPLFHYSLRPNGLLMLGTSETIGRLTHLFEPLESKLRIYRRKAFQSRRHANLLLESFPPMSTLHKEQPVSSHQGHREEIPESLQAAADQLLLRVYAPAAVVLNDAADIVYISGRTGKYLEPASGNANWNIYAMAREGLREPLYSALQQAADNPDEPLQVNGLLVETESGTQTVDLTIQALRQPRVLKGMTMIIFRDAPTRVAADNRKSGTASQTEQAETIQRYQKDIQTLQQLNKQSREDLQASNEELQSTNEELQSANEELTTSKEEMQSMNEELQTINSELQTKLDDLALAQSDMQNVLNSIEIAVLFLDKDLNVRRYTDRTAAIINLRESDIGRPLSDLTSRLQYPELLADARRTLDTLEVSEKQIATDDGHWFAVRIIPNGRQDSVVDGVVITMIDITEAMKPKPSEPNQPQG